MTAPARITQADMERATKAAAAAGVRARIEMDLVNQKISIIIHESDEAFRVHLALSEPASADHEEWLDDDF